MDKTIEKIEESIDPLFHALENLSLRTAPWQRDVGSLETLMELPGMSGLVNALNQGAEVNGKNKHQQTLLHLAVNDGLDALVDLLIQKGADVGACNGMTWTPLHLAVQHSRLEIAKLLIAAKAPLEAQAHRRNSRGFTPLLLACMEGDYKMVELLLSAGADPRATDEAGRSCMHYAATYPNVGVLERLMEEGADMHARDSEGLDPFEFGKARLYPNQPTTAIDWLASRVLARSERVALVNHCKAAAPGKKKRI